VRTKLCLGNIRDREVLKAKRYGKQTRKMRSWTGTYQPFSMPSNKRQWQNNGRNLGLPRMAQIGYMFSIPGANQRRKLATKEIAMTERDEKLANWISDLQS